MVTQSRRTWTVYIYDHQNRLVQLEFRSYAAARLFLDAAALCAPTQLARRAIKAETRPQSASHSGVRLMALDTRDEDHATPRIDARR